MRTLCILLVFVAWAGVDQAQGAPGKMAEGRKQEKTEPVSKKETGEKTPDGRTPYVPSAHRLRFGLGLGRGRVMPAVLSETGNAWLINSAVHASQDAANNPVAAPVDSGAQLPYRSWQLFAEYGYLDRYFLSFAQHSVNEEYTRASPAKVTFVTPPTTNLQPAFFEGVRLLEQNERRRNLDFSYLHPVLTRGFKAGAGLGREWYREDQLLSFGSFVQTRSTAPTNPSTVYWSQAGDVRSVWESSYWRLGLLARYQLFDWLGFSYRLDPLLRRSGDLQLAGAQLLATGPVGGSQTGLHVLAPFHVARVSESGRRHTLEAELRFCCRYTLHVGYLREDWMRRYDSYAGVTPATGGSFSALVQDGIGFGQLAGEASVPKHEVYFKVSVAAVFGTVAVESTEPKEAPKEGPKEPAKDVKEPPPAKSEFGLKEGALARLGSSTYLDQMFTGIKSDLEDSGMKLKEIAGGFEALGLKLEKVKGPDGKTQKLKISMDGTIGFELGSSRLTKIAGEIVAKIGKAMNAYPETKVRLGGHVDCCAPRQYSLNLSQARADSAKDALIKKHGLAPARILESRGYADDRMLIPVRRLEPRNRRVEFDIETN